MLFRLLWLISSANKSKKRNNAPGLGGPLASGERRPTSACPSRLTLPRQREEDNKTLVFCFEKKAGVTATPPGHHHHVARFLFCPLVPKLETLEAIKPGPRLIIFLKAPFKTAPTQKILLGW